VDLRAPSVAIEAMDEAQRTVWLDDLEQAGQDLLATLPVGSYETTGRPPESASLTLSVDGVGLEALAASPMVAVVEELPPSPLVVDASGEPAVRAARDAVPNEYIVLFKEEAFSRSARADGRLGAEVSSLARSIARARGASVQAEWSRAVVGMGARMSARAAAALAKDPRVALVEQNSRVYTTATQSPAVWGLDRVDQRDLPLNNVYNYANGGNSVTAYVIDTGIRTSHSEFGGRATWGVNYAGDGVNSDCHGHGTHVAGTVGGATYGIAKNVALVAVKVLDCNGSGTSSGVISGVNWVLSNKKFPAVANMSLGGGYSASLNTAVANAAAGGVTMVVAAGNSNANACNASPASEPTAITVGATTSTDARSSFSNYGTCLDLFAPGSSIVSATRTSDTSTGTMSGTSMAAPHAAGAAALYLSANPSAMPAAVANALALNATTGKITSAGTGSPNRLLFTGDSNRVSLYVAKAGAGTVASTPAGIDCGTACTADFDRDTTVTLTAEPASGFSFSGWSGDCTGTSTCSLVMNAGKSVTATFVDPAGLTEVFPAGGAWPTGWTTPSGSNVPWSVVTSPVTEGSYSLRSGAIGHSRTSAIEITDVFSAGTLSFDWTVSSESNYDWLSFYIDGVRQTRISGCSTWSTSCWRSLSYPMTSGTHTLRWEYVKDGIVASGADAGWLDNVVLPVQVAEPNKAPVADAGGSYSGVVGEPIDFNGSGSYDSDRNIVSYSWNFGDNSELGTGPTPSHAYGTAGDYNVTLTVEDDDGARATSTAMAIVSAAPATPIQVFADSFENGGGSWTQDSQNDWMISTQRATTGSRSVEVDGRATDAQLFSVPISLNGATTAVITFDWLIESGLDTGEYLAFDTSTDGGTTWLERGGLRGNVDRENLWHSARFELTGLPSGSSLRLRFRGRMSASDEDANVDNISVMAQ
jgi:subtilisin family serine protease